MELNNLRNQLKAGQLSSLYIFTGSEWALKKKYTNWVLEVSGLNVVREETFANAYKEMVAPKLLGGFSVYVIRDDKDVLSGKVELSVLKGNIVILLLNTVDKRTKFYKAYKDAIVDFQPLKPEILKKYVQKEIPLSDRSCEKLISACENDYGRCLLEIDKMKQYRAGMDYTDDNKVYNHVLKELLDGGTIYTPPYDAIFDFVDAVLDRNINLSYNLYRQCREFGEATLVMITVLYDNARAVLQVQSCESRNVSKTTGLLDWQIRNAQKHIGVHKNSELLQLMSTLHKCEMGIKKGTIDEKIAVDYILATFL